MGHWDQLKVQNEKLVGRKFGVDIFCDTVCHIHC